MLIVVVNKMDVVDWDYESFAYVIGELKKFFKDENLNSFGHIEYIPISAISGENIDKPVENPKANWWAGGCLFDHLSNNSFIIFF